MWCLLIDRGWHTMMGATNNTNLSNLAKLKLVKVLNNLGVVCIVANTFQTPTLESIEWPVPFSNSLVLSMLDELVTTIAIAKAHYFCLSMSTNISCIPSSLENEELELFDLEILELSLIEPWFEDEAMIFKWKNPSTWMRSEREKKWVRGAPTYIVPTHKTKHMGLKQRLWKPFLPEVEDLAFGSHSRLRGLIMSGDKD